MTVVLLGFTSAVVFGASDFFGGLASRRASALVVALLANAVAVLVGLAAWWPLGLAGVGSELSGSALLWGALAGLSGTIGTWAFYAALAIGPMSVVSPGVAAIYALLPAAVGLAGGERFSATGWIALVAVFVAGLLLALTKDGFGQRPTPRALVLGELAVVGVLNSLYPLGTVLLALVLLRERLGVVQWIGVGLALLGSALLGLG